MTNGDVAEISEEKAEQHERLTSRGEALATRFLILSYLAAWHFRLPKSQGVIFDQGSSVSLSGCALKLAAPTW